MNHTVEYIPADWLERAAWAAHCGERMALYSRPIQIERRSVIRRAVDRNSADRRTTDEPVTVLQSLQLEEALV